ncbi:hypothetical protein [Pseudoxanthomonas koreensis]|uniref:hypothetical protein n=1 Tax=Pseudoxanthomonas koreensis TaxID=266061 RepID=UPI0035A728D3
MAWLSLLLFLPWFGLISVLYWYYPRQPRPPARRVFDAVVLVLALVLSVAGMQWGYAEGMAHAGSGPIWRQVLAVLYGYGAFLAVMTVALLLRQRLLAGRWSGRG